MMVKAGVNGITGDVPARQGSGRRLAGWIWM